ncbi:hypothetical protein ABZ023_25880 [Streptomyces sp. NPDC006367]|uniref:hypothetical protein n=1 Tax=unclassified Streptomyces TaxID=2593676 RepID=UPI0033BDAC63
MRRTALRLHARSTYGADHRRCRWPPHGREPEPHPTAPHRTDVNLAAVAVDSQREIDLRQTELNEEN